MAKVIKAKFSSICPACKKPIDKGDEIVYSPKFKRFIHVVCPTLKYRKWSAVGEPEPYLDEKDRWVDPRTGEVIDYE